MASRESILDLSNTISQSVRILLSDRVDEIIDRVQSLPTRDIAEALYVSGMLDALRVNLDPTVNPEYKIIMLGVWKSYEDIVEESN